MDSGEDGGAPADPALLAGARDGDVAAALALLDGHRGRIRWACRELDEDETSELLVGLLEDARRIFATYDGDRPLGPYLFVVAKHRAISLLRRRPRTPLSLDVLDEIIGIPADASDDPERRAVGQDLLDRIHIDLTDADWIVLQTCTGQLTDEAAASCLETTPVAIRIRRFRLRTKLSEHLEEGS
ncbi:MAG: sigma-70 family RNA polymerase sigma factor [Actinomycetota bacterium]